MLCRDPRERVPTSKQKCLEHRDIVFTEMAPQLSKAYDAMVSA